MSLAPGEQQALTAIETGLRASDPRFAQLLERLANRLTRARKPGRASRWRSLPRHQRALQLTMAAIIATLLAAGAVAGAVIASHGGHAAARPGHAAVSGTTTSAPGQLFQG
jgi:Protein of unknown function (DUF3040)